MKMVVKFLVLKMEEREGVGGGDGRSGRRSWVAPEGWLGLGAGQLEWLRGGEREREKKIEGWRRK